MTPLVSRVLKTPAAEVIYTDGCKEEDRAEEWRTPSRVHWRRGAGLPQSCPEALTLAAMVERFFVVVVPCFSSEWFCYVYDARRCRSSSRATSLSCHAIHSRPALAIRAARTEGIGWPFWCTAEAAWTIWDTLETSIQPKVMNPGHLSFLYESDMLARQMLYNLRSLLGLVPRPNVNGSLR